MRLTALALVLAVFVVACGGDEDEPTPTMTPEAAARTNERDSIRIPAIEVHAPVTLKQRVPNQPLPSPDSPGEVAMYDFGPELRGLGGAPGQGGNIVLAGENANLRNCPDGPPPCLAVFGMLQVLEPGAAIDLVWDGQVHQYQLVALCSVPTRDFGDGLYRRTAEEQLTLLTGAGAWTPQTGWSYVVIAIAKPAPRTAIEPCPEGTSEGAPG